MECVSTWPLLQRNKIEDSKINIAVQAIADTTIPEDDVMVAETLVKPEETPKPQELKTEPSESANPEPIEPTADQSLPLIKSENPESVDIPVPVDPTNCATSMVVDELNLEFGRSRTSERLESQAMRLKRLASKVTVLKSAPLRY